MHGANISRRNFLLLAGLTICSPGLMGQLIPDPPEGEAVDADEILETLMEGNARYVKLRRRAPEVLTERRDAILLGERPIAAVLCCSDPRVVPETIFDEGLNDIFDVRVAGNTLSDPALGSLEYAVKKLNLRLVMVLGHEDCGAVRAAVERSIQGVNAIGHIDNLITPILPAVASAQRLSGDLVESTIRENVKQTVEQMRSADPIMTNYSKLHGLKIVGAFYHLQTGVVELLDI
jgi:carbonic anhydrase